MVSPAVCGVAPSCINQVILSWFVVTFWARSLWNSAAVGFLGTVHYRLLHGVDAGFVLGYWCWPATVALALVMHCTLIFKMFHNTMNVTICGSITCFEVELPAETPAGFYIRFSLIPQSHHFCLLPHCQYHSWATQLEILRNKQQATFTKTYNKKKV